MLHLLLSAALAPLVITADASLAAGTQLSYHGTVEAQAADADRAVKTFDLTLWVLSRNDAGANVFWLVDERGNGQFAWPRRFGRAQLDARWRAPAGNPALWYDWGEGQSSISVPWPFLANAEPLAIGATFEHDQLAFTVDKAGKAGETPVWRLSARDPFGQKRALAVDRERPLVVQLSERLTMGRGDEYQLKFELVVVKQLSRESLASLAAAIEGFTALAERLNLPAEGHAIDWNAAQLEALSAQLPEVARLAVGTPLAPLAEAAQRDSKLQAGRHDAVADLQARFHGSQVEAFSVRGLANEGLSLDHLKGQITVLHFWDYRDEPLREPYGQVGYLDFLYHNRKDRGLKLYGVAVNGRLGDETTKAAAERSVKKLKAFMNLSYPLLLDSGALLEQFGDPRVLGANLPLFVVIGPDAKIVHYHVGHYDVQQDAGLKELDDAVLGALEKQ